MDQSSLGACAVWHFKEDKKLEHPNLTEKLAIDKEYFKQVRIKIKLTCSDKM